MLERHHVSPKLSSDMSSFLSCSIGVPHGSVRDPVLFYYSLTTYLRQLNIVLLTYLLMILRCTERNEIYILLKFCYNKTNISRWFYDNKLNVNTRKTCVLKVGSRHKVNTSRELRLQVNGNILDQVDTALYLDCTTDQYLQWDVHINALVQSYPKSCAFLST